MKRFYESVEVVASAGAFAVALSGKPILTPGRASMVVPTRALAAAIAADWESQGDTIRPDDMALQKLANTAIDRVAPRRGQVVRTIAGYGDSDVVCYLAGEPEELIDHQERHWRPLRGWIENRHGVRLAATNGIVHAPQDPAALTALEALVAAYDDFALAALFEFAAITGSVVIALALAEGEIETDRAWAAAFADELYQARHWGEDEEAAAKRHRLGTEFREAVRFLELLRA